MPLARSMTLGFIPCVGAAALANVVFEPDRWVRIGRLSVAGVVAVLTSLTWLWKSGPFVWWYLFEFGYGSRAVEYGSKITWLGRLQERIDRTADEIYLPHTLIIGVGLVAGIVLLFKAVSAGLLAPTLRSSVTPLVVFSLMCVMMLSSTQNEGSAFIAPALPAVYVAAVAMLYGAGGRASGWLNLAVAATALVAFLPFADLRWSLAAHHEIDTPWRSFVVSDGSGTQERYEAAYGINTANPGRLLPADHVEAWKLLNARTAERLGEMPAAMGFRSVVYNVNTVRLSKYLGSWADLEMIPIEPMAIDGLDQYKAWLLPGGQAARACTLLTAAGNQAEFPPLVNTSVLEQAARAVGFARVDEWSMPNGRVVRMWARPCPSVMSARP
jgi:hypothetical protein